MKTAKLSDCPIILSFLETKVSHLNDFAAMYGEDFSLEVQFRIVEFLESLTDEQLSFVFMMAYLTREREEK